MCKTFLANLADEGVGDLVDWHVFFKIYSGGKRSLTEVALKTFVTMETLHVLDKIVSERKGLVTVITLPFILEMKSEVFLQISFTNCLTTYSTFSLICST